MEHRSQHFQIEVHCFLLFVPIHMNRAPMTITMKLFISFIVFTSFFFNSFTFSASAVQVSYADYCASVVPESTEKTNAGSHFVHLIHTGYYYTGGGIDILNLESTDYQVYNSVDFQCWDIRETDVQGLFKLEGTLQFQVVHTHYQQSQLGTIVPGSVTFRLNGFWSESSGKLCMIGSVSGYSKQGNPLVVLKLYNLINSTTVTNLISGTFESVMISENDPNYLGPISILMFPRINYEYTLVSTKSENSCSGGHEDTPSSLQVDRFCPLLSRVVLNHDSELKFSSHCVSAKNCTPISMSDLPRAVTLKDIACSEDKRRVRVLVEFADGRKNLYEGIPRLFNSNTTLVGEGSWDAKKNQLCVVACQFLNATSLNNTHVGDCSTRLSLRFPATGTIGNTSSIVGHIWSTKTVTELGYFGRITFASPDYVRLPGQTYEYTKMDRVTKLCSKKKTANDKASIYPNPLLHDMSFTMHAKNSEGQVASGNCVPFSVDNQFYQTRFLPGSNQQYPPSYSYRNHTSTYNISYKISLQLQSNPKLGKQSFIYEMHISAEGMYDDTEGSLCMVGCRNLGSNSQQPTNDKVDCEMLVNFQFPPTNAKGSRHIKGTIESTRKKSDPLHFEHLDLSTAAKDEGKQSIWRMDGKITLVLVSTTLACVFAALQLFHVKKHPEVLPSISILMLLILTLGYMLPSGLNFEATFMHMMNRHHVMLGSGRWLEVNEILIRVTTLLAFWIQFHILKLTWSARSGNGIQKDILVMEKKALSVALQVYVVGALAALFLRRQILRKRDNGIVLQYLEHPVLDALISYGGLVLDGFLFPQILLNMFCKSRENALSSWFYIGTTLARALPHVYDLYRAHSSADDQLDKYSYIHPSPVADFYSTAWNAIIPVGGLLLAGIVYLQQQFGGRCIAPRKLRGLGAYEKVSTVHEE